MRRLWIIALSPLLAAPGSTEYHFHRAIEAAPGWADLAIPTDVLEATRPGLPDLRIRSDRGEEIPYADARSLPTSVTKLPVADVEMVPSKETTALVDRGDRPGFTDNLDIEVAETRFIKPVVLDASSDRATWSEIARSSIFATGS